MQRSKENESRYEIFCKEILKNKGDMLADQ